MAGMFKLCKELISLDLSNFNTSQVNDMHGMFKNCEKLEDLNILNFNIKDKINIKSFIYNVPDNCNIKVNVNIKTLKMISSSAVQSSLIPPSKTPGAPFGSSLY